MCSKREMLKSLSGKMHKEWTSSANMRSKRMRMSIKRPNDYQEEKESHSRDKALPDNVVPIHRWKQITALDLEPNKRYIRLII